MIIELLVINSCDEATRCGTYTRVLMVLYMQCYSLKGAGRKQFTRKSVGIVRVNRHEHTVLST